MHQAATVQTLGEKMAMDTNKQGDVLSQILDLVEAKLAAASHKVG
jgi:hypothetical protein